MNLICKIGGYRGFHCEGGGFGVIFTLLCWNVLWLDIKGNLLMNSC